MPDLQNSSDDFHQRRLAAEGIRQAQHEWARGSYERARAAERAYYDAKVQATKERLAAAEVPIEFIPDGYELGSGNRAFDAALAELDSAKAAVEQLPRAPDHKALRDQLDASISLADAQFNAALAAGFPAS